jgi:hypothetical protein
VLARDLQALRKAVEKRQSVGELWFLALLGQVAGDDDQLRSDILLLQKLEPVAEAL